MKQMTGLFGFTTLDGFFSWARGETAEISPVHNCVTGHVHMLSADAESIYRLQDEVAALRSELAARGGRITELTAFAQGIVDTYGEVAGTDDEINGGDAVDYVCTLVDAARVLLGGTSAVGEG